jgi:hypothetical protein
MKIAEHSKDWQEIRCTVHFLLLFKREGGNVDD